MKIVKSNYENYEKRVNDQTLTSSLSDGIKNGSISYFEILNNDESYITNFEVYDKDDNWLVLNVHDRNSIIDDSEMMHLILFELKRYYSSVTLRISEEFKDRIEKTKKYGFIEKGIKKQGDYNYIELKIEF